MLCRLLVFLVVAALPCLAQNGMGNNCTIAGTWYGGSAVAYQLTITPSTPAGHYSFTFDPMYVNPQIPMIAKVTGELVKRGDVYEGSMLSLAGGNLPADQNYKMPDITVGWNSMQLLDCNTIKNTIPFFGMYFGANIWQPGTSWTGINWVSGGKVPLLDSPDVDLIPVVTGDVKPIVETYHRLPKAINPNLVHH